MVTRSYLDKTTRRAFSGAGVRVDRDTGAGWRDSLEAQLEEDAVEGDVDAAMAQAQAESGDKPPAAIRVAALANARCYERKERARAGLDKCSCVAQSGTEGFVSGYLYGRSNGFVQAMARCARCARGPWDPGAPWHLRFGIEPVDRYVGLTGLLGLAANQAANDWLTRILTAIGEYVHERTPTPEKHGKAAAWLAEHRLGGFADRLQDIPPPEIRWPQDREDFLAELRRRGWMPQCLMYTEDTSERRAP